MRQTKKCFFAVVLAFAGTTALCDAAAVEDGNAGLDALNNAQFDKAITQFSNALRAGGLDKVDQEFAYYNRGIAYLWKGNYDDAYANFKIATFLKPDDSNARGYLSFAQNFARHIPPSMPTEIANLKSGSFLSGGSQSDATKSWLAIDPRMQNCLTFQYGLDPVKLAGKGIGTDRAELAPFAKSCDKVAKAELARDAAAAKSNVKSSGKPKARH